VERRELRCQLFHALLQRVAVHAKFNEGPPVPNVEPEVLRQSIDFVR
jgi:hypothetical protein